MKTKHYKDRLKIQFMDNSMWGIFMKWLAKINKKRDLVGIDKAKKEKVENPSIKPTKEQQQRK